MKAARARRRSIQAVTLEPAVMPRRSGVWTTEPQLTVLILLDLMMPVMDGWEFLRRRAADAVLSAIPVIVLSAQPPKAQTFDDVLEVFQKPFAIDKLTAVIARVCGAAAGPSGRPANSAHATTRRK